MTRDRRASELAPSPVELGTERGGNREVPVVEPVHKGAAAPVSILALQRGAGNRAVTELVGRDQGASESARMLQRQTTQVTKQLTEPRSGGKAAYSWMAAYEVRFTDTECILTVKAKIVLDADVTAAQATKVKSDTSTEFARIWDNKFRLTETGTNKVYTLRVVLSYVDSGEHVAIQLHKGTGRDNRRNWYVDSIPTDRAHELGHQIGLKDEYIDPEVPARANAAAPGVFKDQSIMGDYYTEGIGQAEAKLRHGTTIGGDIGGATKRTFSASLTNAFLLQQLARIRAEVAKLPDGAQKTQKQAECRAIEQELKARGVAVPAPAATTPAATPAGKK